MTADRAVPAPAGPPGLAPAPGRPAMRVTTACSVGAVLAAALGVLAVGLSDPSGAGIPMPVQVAVVAVGIVLGIPHGAVDHVVCHHLVRRDRGGERGRDRSGPDRTGSAVRTMAAVLGGYLLVAALAAAALLTLPDLSTAVFLVVAAGHFAWGELTFAEERLGRPLATRRTAPAVVAAVGAVLIGLPLASEQGRAAVAPLAPELASLLDRALGVLPGPVLTPAPGGPTTPAAVLAVVGLGVVVLVVSAWRRGWRREAGEVATLAALFVLAPPLVAFAVYFGAWHAVRHTRRLVDLLVPGGERTAQATAFVRLAALPTAGALVVLLGLWALRADAGIVVGGISVLIALTFPHVLVVLAFDRDRSSPGGRTGRSGRPEGTRHGDRRAAPVWLP